TSAFGRRDTPGRLWHAGGRQYSAGSSGLPDQYRVCRKVEPGHPSARGSGRTSGEYAVPRRRRLAASTGAVPHLLQFHIAPCELTPALAAVGAHHRYRLGQDVAAVYAGDGSGIDCPRLDTERSVAVSGPAVAPAADGLRNGTAG